MDSEAIAQLLVPYLASGLLSKQQLEQVSSYLELLGRWMSKVNLTAIRDQDEIVQRHFGESFFAASRLKPQPGSTVFDVGSGAGFPGLPIAIFSPQAQVTLIESQSKKATFLKEAVRLLGLQNVTVHGQRAESLGRKADLITMRAVERFAEMAPMAAELMSSKGTLALLIGSSQIEQAKNLLPSLVWDQPVLIPGSATRVLQVGLANDAV